MIENRETINLLSATAVGFGVSGLLEVGDGDGEDSSSGMVSGEDLGKRSSSHSSHSPEKILIL